jgi:hypothetical protein
MTTMPPADPGKRSSVAASEAEGRDTFPFQPGDRVEVIYPDVMWDESSEEFYLVVGAQGTVTEVCWDPIWTTHVVVDFPDQGCLCVGWDVIRLVERLPQCDRML